MRSAARISFAMAIFAAVSLSFGDGAPQQGDVQLAVEADKQQPAGWPVVVEVTLTNTGKKAIGWWCGGPDAYPGAEHFSVEVRCGPEMEWHSVFATNGQYSRGSGIDRELKPGESITVPLAIPVGKAGWIAFTIKPRDWHAVKAKEYYVELSDERQYIDARRARVVAAVISQASPFWTHMAEQYADHVVVDSLLKLITVDNGPIVSAAAKVLARQKTLPAAAGETFAGMIGRWLPYKPRTWSGGHSYPDTVVDKDSIAEAALKTQSELVRGPMLKLMAETTNADTRALIINALRESPGDEPWLLRAKTAISLLRARGPDDVDLDRQKTITIERLDGRINHPQ